ncbi:MAG: response regulator [Hyphomonadaceae bacterium]|nr:response regulator [Hyphomonadaceae bacterium]
MSMARWTLARPDSLVQSARYNARFGWVRLPIILVVAAFLAAVHGWIIATTWAVAMGVSERVSSGFRTRLTTGDASFALPHLMSLGCMAALWVTWGVLLWNSDAEVGRLAAVIGLLTTALYGAIGGLKDFRVAAILSVPPLVALLVLVALHGAAHWNEPLAIISTLATLGASLSILIGARTMHRSNVALEDSNNDLARTSAALASSNLLLEEMSAIAKTGGWWLDLSTRNLEWTAATKDIFGVEPDFKPDLVNIREFCIGGTLETLEAATRIAFERDENYDIELQIRTRAGEEKWLRVNGKVLFENGRAYAIIGASTDITDRVRLEKKLRQAQKLEAVGLLTGGVAHDFNNTLTAILSSSELLKSSPDARTVNLASAIERAAERAGDLTGKLMAFSGQQVLRAHPVNLNDVVRDTIGLTTAGLRSDLSLNLELCDEAPVALLDGSQLTHALLNLAINAADAMPTGGDLTFRTGKSAKGRVFVEVADTGAGIPKDILDRIFDPFFTTKPAGVGSGLGLSMVHGFVSQSGGSVEVQTAEGCGATFRLSFPEVAPNVRPPEPVASTKEVPGDAPLSNRTVLVVDDDPLVRESLALLLSDRGATVLVAEDGPSALAKARGIQLHLAVVDVVLTKAMSGPALVEALHGEHPESGALLISGYAQGTPLPKGDRRVQFLQKPFSADVLIERLRSLC